MATARPFAYNPGSLIPGTEQLGSLSVGFPTSGITNNPQYWNGPDEDLGYIIAQPVSANTQPTPLIGVNSSVGFFRTNGKNDTNFTNLTNSVYSQNFTTPLQSKNYLHANGLWTSWPQDLPEGVVLLLDAANTNSYPTSGTSWFDLSGNQNNGTLVNGPTFSSNDGGIIVFDGVNDYVTIPSFTSTSQNMSFSLWFNPSSLPAGVAVNVVFLQSENSTTRTIRLYRNTSGAFLVNQLSWLVYYERTSLIVSSILPQYTYPLSAWTNTVLTFDDTGNYNTYIDGVLFNTTQAEDFLRWFTPAGYLRIAGIPSGPFNGKVSNLTIWEQTLSPQEILQYYNSTKSKFGL